MFYIVGVKDSSLCWERVNVYLYIYGDTFHHFQCVQFDVMHLFTFIQEMGTFTTT